MYIFIPLTFILGPPAEFSLTRVRIVLTCCIFPLYSALYFKYDYTSLPLLTYLLAKRTEVWHHLFPFFDVYQNINRKFLSKLYVPILKKKWFMIVRMESSNASAIWFFPSNFSAVFRGRQILIDFEFYFCVSGCQLFLTCCLTWYWYTAGPL